MWVHEKITYKKRLSMYVKRVSMYTTSSNFFCDLCGSVTLFSPPSLILFYFSYNKTIIKHPFKLKRIGLKKTEIKTSVFYVMLSTFKYIYIYI